jgi:hypothetical protein
VNQFYMRDCSNCHFAGNSLTAMICDACGEPLPQVESPAAHQRTVANASAQLAGEEVAKNLVNTVNAAVALLKASPPTSRLKNFIIGFLSVPTFGVAYLVAKFFYILGRSDRSFKLVKITLRQNLQAIADGYKADSGMQKVLERGKDALKEFERAEHTSRMALVYGMLTSSVLLFTLLLAIYFGVNAAGEKAASRALKEHAIQTEEARRSEARAAAVIAQSQTNPAALGAILPQPGALVVVFSNEPRIVSQQLRNLETIVSAKVAGLGFRTITREMAIDSIANALKNPALSDRKSWLEILSENLNKPGSAPKTVQQQIVDQNSTVQLARSINVDVLIVVTVESLSTEIKTFNGNELAPTASSIGVNELSVSYFVAYAANGKNASGGTVKVSRTVGNSENLSVSNDGLVNSMVEEAATLVAKRITDGRAEDDKTNAKESDSSPTVDKSLGKKRVCIGSVMASHAVLQKMASKAKAADLDQTIESLESALIAQLAQGRKLEVVARKGALKNILAEQEFGESGRVNPSTAAKAFKLAGAHYLIVAIVTDFMVGSDSVRFDDIGVTGTREAVRIGCDVHIYSTDSGALIESAQFRGGRTGIIRDNSTLADGGTLSAVIDSLAPEICGRVIDAIYPAKVAVKFGGQVTINRGEGAGMAVGQMWKIFALGQEILDPDTNEKLGKNEAEVGKVRISRVTPNLSYGEVVEDRGIEVGSIARPLIVTD